MIKTRDRNMSKKKELECLNCPALIDVTDAEQYDIVECQGCYSIFEYDGQDIIHVEYDDE